MSIDGRNEPDGWTSHEADQKRAWLRLTPMERLEWLEGALAFARKYLGAARKWKGPAPKGPPVGDP